jgi:uncharacterized protein YndB with AHSA1/START domain
MSGPSRAVTRIVAAPAGLVWDLVSDVTRMGEWSPENTGAEWVSGEPGAVGSRFKGRNKRGRATWSTTCHVLDAERGRVFAFGVGKAERPDTTWRYELTPLPDGRTEIRESFVLRKPPGWGTRLLTRLTTGVADREADLEEGMRRTLEQLDAAARRESAAPRG